jgi:hypothetical protein
MPNERISMSKLKQLIGLQSSNLSVRARARALDLSVGAVSKYLRAMKAAGIEPAEAQSLTERSSSRGCSGRGSDLPAFCGPFQTSEMAFSGLVSDNCRLNSAGVRFPRLEWGRTSLN